MERPLKREANSSLFRFVLHAIVSVAVTKIIAKVRQRTICNKKVKSLVENLTSSGSKEHFFFHNSCFELKRMTFLAHYIRNTSHLNAGRGKYILLK